eukprot:1146490-Pelagomonas_calceolata.AAC.5
MGHFIDSKSLTRAGLRVASVDMDQQQYICRPGGSACHQTDIIICSTKQDGKRAKLTAVLGWEGRQEAKEEVFGERHRLCNTLALRTGTSFASWVLFVQRHAGLYSDHCSDLIAPEKNGLLGEKGSKFYPPHTEDLPNLDNTSSMGICVRQHPPGSKAMRLSKALTQPWDALPDKLDLSS